MAITVHQTPSAYSPVYNPQMFLATSSQVAQPNFIYRVIVTDLITSESQTYDIYADPDGYCRFNASPFASNYFNHYLPINTYGWQLDTGIRKIRVNIGEYYGSTPTYYAGSNVDYIMWDGIEDVQDFCDYSQANYLYDSTVPRYRYLTNTLNSYAFDDRSDYFYALTKGSGDLQYLSVATYNSAGAQLGYYKIANSFAASSTYTDKYVCIDVGLKGLSNIGSGAVTVISGTYPIITANVAYYDIGETNIGGIVTSGGRAIKRYTVGCSPRFPTFTVHFLRKNGSFQTVHFAKRSEFSTNKDEKTVGKYPYQRVSNTYIYKRSTEFEKTISVITTDNFTLNTDWLSSDEVELYKELFDSPLIYLDEGSSNQYRVIKYTQNSYKLSPSYDSNLVNLRADFSFTNKNYRQRG